MDVSWWKVSKHVSAAMSKCAEQVPKIPPKWSVLLGKMMVRSGVGVVDELEIFC